MPVCRLIYRLDYKIRFDIFDRTSKILQLMDEVGEDFWDSYRDDPLKRRVTGKKESIEKKYLRTLTVTPVSIDCNLERHNGIELAGLENDPILTKIIQITNSVRKEFKINELIRSGLRLYFFDKLELGEGTVPRVIEKLISADIMNNINNELGPLSDVGFAFDGEHDDKIQYHYRFGPYLKGESRKYLSYHATTFDESCDYNFVVDIDLYETNFALAESVNYMKWCRAIFEKANKTIESTKKTIIESGGE